MIEADQLYSLVKLLCNERNDGYVIPENGYLQEKDFDVVKYNLNVFGRSFKIQYNDDAEIYGSLNDQANIRNVGYKLIDGLDKLFETHTTGILIANSKSFAIIKSTDKFHFADSHSCGPKGSTSRNGKACVIQCDNINELHRICKRATGSKNIQYIINYIDVQQNATANETASTDIAVAANDYRYKIQEQHLTVTFIAL